MGLSATTVFRKLASMLADKWNVNIIIVTVCSGSDVGCVFPFSDLVSVSCLRGHRSSKFHPIPSNVDLAYSKG